MTTTDSALSARIDQMLKRDIAVGITFAALMWLALIFTFSVTAGVVEDGVVTAVMGIACALLGIFNTLALLSMIRRYRAERDHIYREDIHHFDAARAARAGGGRS